MTFPAETTALLAILAFLMGLGGYHFILLPLALRKELKDYREPKNAGNDTDAIERIASVFEKNDMLSTAEAIRALKYAKGEVL